MLTDTQYMMYLDIALAQRLRQLANFEKQFGVTSQAYLALQSEIATIRNAIQHHRTQAAGPTPLELAAKRK